MLKGDHADILVGTMSKDKFFKVFFSYQEIKIVLEKVHIGQFVKMLVKCLKKEITEEEKENQN